MRRVLFLLAGTMLSTQAWALDQCTPSPSDKQVRVCVYNPLQRYAVNDVVGFTVNLAFSPDETIKRIEFAYTGRDEKGNPVQTWTGPGEKKVWRQGERRRSAGPGQPVPQQSARSGRCSAATANCSWSPPGRTAASGPTCST